jgi:hypothetical protein
MILARRLGRTLPSSDSPLPEAPGSARNGGDPEAAQLVDAQDVRCTRDSRAGATGYLVLTDDELAFGKSCHVHLVECVHDDVGSMSSRRDSRHAFSCGESTSTPSTSKIAPCIGAAREVVTGCSAARDDSRPAQADREHLLALTDGNRHLSAERGLDVGELALE